MSPPSLDEAYFSWLYRFVGPIRNRNPNRSYWQLAEQLHNTEFRWMIPNDDNRAEDGRELRDQFLAEKGIPLANHQFMSAECSILEMVIALAQRTAFDADGDAHVWTGTLLENLGFHRYTDAVYNSSVQREVADTLDQLNRRTYGRDGSGGLFPLRRPEKDQRRVELWYQKSSYLLERFDVD